MDCKVESPAVLHQLHVNKESAASQFCARVDTPPFSPTATSRPTGQSLPPVLEEVTKPPIVETQNTLTDGPSAEPSPSPFEAVDVGNPKASYAFSQLHKYMEERLENAKPQAVISHSGLNFDPPPEQVKRESQKWNNRSTKPSIEIALQQEASFKFNAVLVELLELVPQDYTSRLLHPVKSQGSSSANSDEFDVNRYCDCVQDALSGSQKIVNNSQETREDPDPGNQLQSDGFDTLDSSTAKCDESVESSVGDPDMTDGACQMTAINFDTEEDTSNQTDGAGVLDALNASQKISIIWEEPESNDQTDAVNIDVMEGLTASQKVADNSDVREEPETTDQTAGVAIDAIEGLIASQKIADNSDVTKEPETTDHTAGAAIDAREDLTANQKIADNSDAREEPESTDQTAGVTIDGMEGLIASQKISDNPDAIEDPDRADKTPGVAHEVLDGLIVSQKTANSSDVREEEPHPADQLQTDDVDVPDADSASQTTANNSDATYEEPIRDAADVIASQKTANNSDSIKEDPVPDPSDQLPIEGVDVPDAITARQKTANNSNAREEEPYTIDEFQTDRVDATDVVTARQKTANNWKGREEPDFAQQNAGFGIRDRILRWESKGKSILSNENKLPPSSSPAFDNVMKELRHVVPRDSKILKSKDETGESSPGGKETWKSQRPNTGVRGLLSEFALRIMHYTA